MDEARTGRSEDRAETAWGHGAPLAAICLMTVVAYAGAFGGSFVFDDVQQVRDRPLARDLGLVFSWQGFLEMPRRWFGYATFALNRAVTGADVVGFHAVNIGIHLATSAVVYALVLAAFRTPRVKASALRPGAQALAFAAAALFALHPLQTQAVTYIVQRFASLATLLYGTAVVLFLAWRTRRAEGRRRAPSVLLYVALLAAALLAALTKEIAVTLPLAIVAAELSFFEPLSWRRRGFLVPVVAAALVPVATLALGAHGGRAQALGAATRSLTEMSRTEYLYTQAPVIARYLGLLAWPAGQSLEHDVAVARGPWELRVLLAAALIAGLLALAVLLLRSTRARAGAAGLDPAARVVSFGIFWFFAGLLVESSVIPIVDLMNEHRVYLPSVGVAAALPVAAALALLRGGVTRWARAVAVAGAAVAVVLGVVTFRRNLVWRDEVSLWSDAAAKAPGKVRPHANLGGALYTAGRTTEAVAELRRAVELDPTFEYGRAQLGAAYLSLGQLAEAEVQLREAVRLAPADPEALFNLGVVLLRSGRKTAAAPYLREFLRVAPPAYAGARRLAEAALR